MIGLNSSGIINLDVLWELISLTYVIRTCCAMYRICRCWLLFHGDFELKVSSILCFIIFLQVSILCVIWIWQLSCNITFLKFQLKNMYIYIFVESLNYRYLADFVIKSGHRINVFYFLCFSLMQQLSQELDQDETRSFRHQVGSPMTNSPPGRSLCSVLIRELGYLCACLLEFYTYWECMVYFKLKQWL